MKNTGRIKARAVLALLFSFSYFLFLISCTSSNKQKYWDIVKEGGLRIVMQIQLDEVDEDQASDEAKRAARSKRSETVSEFIAAIRSRIEGFGVTNVNIKELDSLGKIQIEMPKVKDLERVERILLKTGKLEFWPTFNCSEVTVYLRSADEILQNLLLSQGEKTEKPLIKLLNLESPFARACIGSVNLSDTALVNKYLNMPQVKAALPANLIPMWSRNPADYDNRFIELIAIKGTDDGKAPLDGSYIAEVNAYYNRNYAYNGVKIKMNDAGTKIWAKMTEESIGKGIVIVIDGRVNSYPTVLERIDGGMTQISGGFSLEEATDLADILKGGQLPASAIILEEKVIEPKVQ